MSTTAEEEKTFIRARSACQNEMTSTDFQCVVAYSKSLLCALTLDNVFGTKCNQPITVGMRCCKWSR